MFLLARCATVGRVVEAQKPLHPTLRDTAGWPSDAGGGQVRAHDPAGGRRRGGAGAALNLATAAGFTTFARHAGCSQADLGIGVEDAGRGLVAELWTYTDYSRILELSTKCAPAEAFQVAAESRA